MITDCARGSRLTTNVGIHSRAMRAAHVCAFTAITAGARFVIAAGFGGPGGPTVVCDIRRAEIVIGLPDDQRLYVVFPTGVRPDLPFSCNAPFLRPYATHLLSRLRSAIRNSLYSNSLPQAAFAFNSRRPILDSSWLRIRIPPILS